MQQQQQTLNITGKIDCSQHHFVLSQFCFHSFWTGSLLLMLRLHSIFCISFHHFYHTLQRLSIHGQNRLPWIRFLLLYLYQFLSQFYFYFDLTCHYSFASLSISSSWSYVLTKQASEHINLIQCAICTLSKNTHNFDRILNCVFYFEKCSLCVLERERMCIWKKSFLASR